MAVSGTLVLVLAAPNHGSTRCNKHGGQGGDHGAVEGEQVRGDAHSEQPGVIHRIYGGHMAEGDFV